MANNYYGNNLGEYLMERGVSQSSQRPTQISQKPYSESASNINPGTFHSLEQAVQSFNPASSNPESQPQSGFSARGYIPLSPDTINPEYKEKFKTQQRQALLRNIEKLQEEHPLQDTTDVLRDIFKIEGRLKPLDALQTPTEKRKQTPIGESKPGVSISISEEILSPISKTTQVVGKEMQTIMRQEVPAALKGIWEEIAWSEKAKPQQEKQPDKSKKQEPHSFMNKLLEDYFTAWRHAGEMINQTLKRLDLGGMSEIMLNNLRKLSNPLARVLHINAVHEAAKAKIDLEEQKKKESKILISPAKKTPTGPGLFPHKLKDEINITGSRTSPAG